MLQRKLHHGKQTAGGCNNKSRALPIEPWVINTIRLCFKWLFPKFSRKYLVRIKEGNQKLFPEQPSYSQIGISVLSPPHTLGVSPLSSPGPRTALPEVHRRRRRSTHLPDLLNGIGEDVNDDKPLLHAGFRLHLHQHCVSEQHEECQVSHLWGTHIPWRWAQVTMKDAKQSSADRAQKKHTSTWQHENITGTNFWSLMTRCQGKHKYLQSRNENRSLPVKGGDAIL